MSSSVLVLTNQIKIMKYIRLYNVLLFSTLIKLFLVINCIDHLIQNTLLLAAKCLTWEYFCTFSFRTWPPFMSYGRTEQYTTTESKYISNFTCFEIRPLQVYYIVFLYQYVYNEKLIVYTFICFFINCINCISENLSV